LKSDFGNFKFFNDTSRHPADAYNARQYADALLTYTAASMASAWFIHWLVWPVRGLYGPLHTVSSEHLGFYF